MDGLGTKLGRIHMQKQDLSKLQLRKVKALKRKADNDNKEATEPTENSNKKQKRDADDASNETTQQAERKPKKAKQSNKKQEVSV